MKTYLTYAKVYGGIDRNGETTPACRQAGTLAGTLSAIPKTRKTNLKKTILILVTIISFFYCLRFGYIWTAYGHGGQIMGIPFALFLLGLTIAYFLSEKTSIFNLAVVLFLSLFGFSVTVEIIRKTKEDYFSFLYYEPEGWVNEILLGWIMAGILTITSMKLIKNKKSR